jgi:hypothetical protein
MQGEEKPAGPCMRNVPAQSGAQRRIEWGQSASQTRQWSKTAHPLQSWWGGTISRSALPQASRHTSERARPATTHTQTRQSPPGCCSPEATQRYGHSVPFEGQSSAWYARRATAFWTWPGVLARDQPHSLFDAIAARELRQSMRDMQDSTCTSEAIPGCVKQ